MGLFYDTFLGGFTGILHGVLGWTVLHPVSGSREILLSLKGFILWRKGACSFVESLMGFCTAFTRCEYHWV